MVDVRPVVSIHWFRRDLRLEDNLGLYRALNDHGNVMPLFIFDTSILQELEDPEDRRVDLIHRTLEGLQKACEALGSSLLIEAGTVQDVWERLLERFTVTAVTANHDHEPYARERDARIGRLLAEKGIPFRTYKDISIFERSEILKDDGAPYTVFTPYMRKWRSKFHTAMIERHPSEALLHRLWRTPPCERPTLEGLGFRGTDLVIPGKDLSAQRLGNYEVTRDIPAKDGTSRMGPHLRFGTVSIREAYRRAFNVSHAYTNELIWREFFMQLLWHFPEHGAAFKPAYDSIPWRVDEEGFAAWCNGRTGYPLVDAGMRELNATGSMHNRVRMVTAGFLCKHLLIDWRWGEAYFAAKLLDFELSSNNGGWQWASGSGCDAAPYFRIFSPTLQQRRFDPGSIYVKKWIPEYGTGDYARPIVEHAMARERAISTYQRSLGRGSGRSAKGSA